MQVIFLFTMKKNAKSIYIVKIRLSVIVEIISKFSTEPHSNEKLFPH